MSLNRAHRSRDNALYTSGAVRPYIPEWDKTIADQVEPSIVKLGRSVLFPIMKIELSRCGDHLGSSDRGDAAETKYCLEGI